MRKHADVDHAVARLKDSGPARMPFTAWDANCAWAALCTISAALVHWFQTHCLTGPLKRAAPKRLRWTLWHLPALVCETGRRVKLRLPTPHPGAKALLAAQHPNRAPRAPSPTSQSAPRAPPRRAPTPMSRTNTGPATTPTAPNSTHRVPPSRQTRPAHRKHNPKRRSGILMNNQG